MAKITNMTYKTDQEILALTEEEFEAYHKECIRAAYYAMKSGGNDDKEFSEAVNCVLVRVRNLSKKSLEHGKDR